ncbi:MAG: hypothetical protein IJC78_02550 [Clostridia bacterium]|nr:hypothetical protein [Clostridia bacterium]
MFKIKWIGQNGYIIYDGKTAICMDPYLSDVVNRVANRPRMFESNTENPKNYTSKLDCGFEMEYNREYAISEVLGDV